MDTIELFWPQLIFYYRPSLICFKVHVGDQKLDVLKSATAIIVEMSLENDKYRCYLETTQEEKDSSILNRTTCKSLVGNL